MKTRSLRDYDQLEIMMHVTLYQSASGRRPIEDFIDDLSKPDQARFIDVYSGICEFGLEYDRADFRQLRGKLWEIKFKTQSGGYRVLYVLIERDHMVWLHAFKKKSQKAPLHELETAEKRMKEVLRHG